MSVRFGLGLFTGQLPTGDDFAREYAETIELVKLAESVGFDSAWVSEHHGSSDGYLPSLLVILGALAAATSRIELGTGLILAPLHDPLRLAEDAVVVDQLSDGRLVLGFGLGWRQEEFRMLRIPFSERADRLDETVRILQLAFTGERFSFRGNVFDYDRVRVTPPPARPGGPPILLGGHARAAILRAARIADGFVCIEDDDAEIARVFDVMNRAARDEGRDPDDFRFTVMLNAFVAESGDPWPHVRAGVNHQWGTYEAWDAGHDTPDHDSMEPIPDEEAERAAIILGTPDELADRLAPIVNAYGRGSAVMDLVVRLHYPGMAFDVAARAVELFAERVIPALAR